MSYFGNALTELLQRKKMTAARLSELSGVGEPMISRYRSGDQKWISPEDLAAIARSASDDPRDRAGLVKAHLHDECIGPGSDLIEISVRGPQELKDVPVRPKISLRTEAEESFDLIREWYIKNPNVREIVDGLGDLLRETSAAKIDDDDDADIAAAVEERQKRRGKSKP